MPITKYRFFLISNPHDNPVKKSYCYPNFQVKTWRLREVKQLVQVTMC